jgi:hypothetical protein
MVKLTVDPCALIVVSHPVVAQEVTVVPEFLNDLGSVVIHVRRRE